MPLQFLIVVSISLIMGILFFLTDFYEQHHPKLHISLIEGVSIAYFFLVLLPEISENIPEIPFDLAIFKFLFIVLGFVCVYVSEKLILQKVEANSQKRMRKLMFKEKILEDVEKNMEHILTRELSHDELDEYALKDITITLKTLNKKEEEFKSEINQYKKKIQIHISEDLSRLRLFTHFAYHLLIGIIIVGLLTDELIDNPIISTILFFFFAWFRALLYHRSESPQMFSDLDMCEIEIEEKSETKCFLACATLLGVIIGLSLELIYPIELGIIYLLFSFVSGVIMYTILREVIPQKEKGSSFYFLIGFFGFTIIIVILDIYSSVI